MCIFFFFSFFFVFLCNLNLIQVLFWIIVFHLVAKAGKLVIFTLAFISALFHLIKMIFSSFRSHSQQQHYFTCTWRSAYHCVNSTAKSLPADTFLPLRCIACHGKITCKLNGFVPLSRPLCRSCHGFMHMKFSQSRDGKFILGENSPPFDSIPEVIHYYTTNKLPIRGAEHLSLLFPVLVQTLWGHTHSSHTNTHTHSGLNSDDYFSASFSITHWRLKQILQSLICVRSARLIFCRSVIETNPGANENTVGL